MHRVAHERDPACPVCSPGRSVRMAASDTLQAFIDRIAADEGARGKALRGPSVSYRSTNLYMTGVLEGETRPNLGRPLGELLGVDGGRVVLTVNDKSLRELLSPSSSMDCRVPHGHEASSSEHLHDDCERHRGPFDFGSSLLCAAWPCLARTCRRQR